MAGSCSISMAMSKGPHRDPTSLISSTTTVLMRDTLSGGPPAAEQVDFWTTVPMGRVTARANEIPADEPCKHRQHHAQVTHKQMAIHRHTHIHIYIYIYNRPKEAKPSYKFSGR